jgi:hypothetical protein
MTTYSIILFLHVASALGLFASLSFELFSLFHLRHASDLPEVRRWIDPVPGLPVLAMSSILVVFFSGIFLAVRMSAFETAWPKVMIAALLLIAPLGAVTGKRMRAIRASFFGIVLPMTARPELWQPIGIVVCSAVLGLLSGIRTPSEIFKNGSCSRRSSSDFIVSASSALHWRGAD